MILFKHKIRIVGTRISLQLEIMLKNMEFGKFLGVDVDIVLILKPALSNIVLSGNCACPLSNFPVLTM